MHDASVHTRVSHLGEEVPSSHYSFRHSKVRMGGGRRAGAESLMSEVSGEGARNGEV